MSLLNKLLIWLRLKEEPVEEQPSMNPNIHAPIYRPICTERPWEGWYKTYSKSIVPEDIHPTVETAEQFDKSMEEMLAKKKRREYDDLGDIALTAAVLSASMDFGTDVTNDYSSSDSSSSDTGFDSGGGDFGGGGASSDY